MLRVVAKKRSSAKRTTKRRKASSGADEHGSSGFDLEALGLVLLAGGVVLGGFLLPSLPTGELGDAVRGALVGRLGWMAWALPWPLLVLGVVFLLRRNPRAWPRVLSGYLVGSAGAWLGLLLIRPDLSGRWGEAVRAQLTGATGGLAYLGAVLALTLGIELIVGWRPMRIVQSAVIALALGIRAVWRAAAATRRRLKERANFRADVALVRRDLQDLDRDLEALGSLYPGSAEIEKWRDAVDASGDRLASADRDTLADVEADADAWRAAVLDFARDRADELAVQLRGEGIDDLEERLKSLGGQLGDPVREPCDGAWGLDKVREALHLDRTAIADRHRRLARSRDVALAELEAMGPRELARVAEEHHRRSARYDEVEAVAERLEVDSDRLEAWRELIGKLARLRTEFPEDAELEDFDSSLGGDFDTYGRDVLGAFQGWSDALDAVELRARQRAVAGGGAAAKADGPDADASAEGVAAGAAGAGAAGGATAHGGATGAGSGAGDAADDVAAAHASGTLPSAPAAGAAAASAGPRAGTATAIEEAPFGRDGGRVEVDPERPAEVGGIPIQVPGLDLLDNVVAEGGDPEAEAREVQARVKRIDRTLDNFNLEGRVVSSVRGPTVTRFEVEPAPGEKISRFSGLSDDLALAMAVGSVRIEAPIPGKSVIGLEVPNADRDLIRFREAAESPSFRRAKGRLPLILGKSIDGEMIVADLAKMPHLLIAGSTGSGKSVAVNTLIGSLIYKFLPTELRLLMIDPKMVELTPYDGIPHLIRPVVNNPSDAAGVLLGAVAHMERRYKMMSKIGAKNLDQYNEKARNLDLPQLPFVILVIDELADLMITSPKEVESAIMRLAQMARATGMHLVLATQRPSVDILTSLIKVNVPARIAFAVSSGHDSRTILDSMGAERLVGMGDMLFYQPGLVKAIRLQGPFIDEPEIQRLAAFLRRQYFDDDFVEAYGSDFDPPSMHQSDADGLIDWNDDKLRDAAELVVAEGSASVSRLQRRLQVGHARAGKLMDSLEALGVVGPHAGSKPRDVLVEVQELPEIFGK